MQVTVNSFVQPIYTSNIEKGFPQQVEIEVQSHVSPIDNNIKHYVDVFENVEGCYSSGVNSFVTMTFTSGDKEIREVSSHIDTLNTYAVTETFRQPLFVSRSVSSHVKQIQASTDVLKYIMPIPIQATVSVLESPSSVFHINNPSYCEVIE